MLLEVDPTAQITVAHSVTVMIKLHQKVILRCLIHPPLWHLRNILDSNIQDASVCYAMAKVWNERDIKISAKMRSHHLSSKKKRRQI